MAELAIGSVSFFFQAFAGCIQGYELIADACRLQDDCHTLLIRFKMEELRLLDWAELVQLNYTDERLVLNLASKGIIMNIMEQQQKLLFAFGRLDKAYGKLRKPLLVEDVRDFVMQNSDHLLENGENSTDGEGEGGRETMRFPPMTDLVKKSLDFMRTSKQVPKRLKWAIFDHKKMETLIVRLADFNDKMHHVLNKTQMNCLMDMQVRTNDQLLLLNQTMSHMIRICQSQQSDHRQQQSPTDLEDVEYDSLLQQNSFVTRQAPFRQPFSAYAQQNLIHLAIENSQHLTQSFADEIHLSHLPCLMHNTELQFNDLTPTDGADFLDDYKENIRTEALYKDREHVWIEWKALNYSEPMQHDDGIDPKVHERVKKLAILLRENNRPVYFRAPFCRGFFVDENAGRLGLVFEKPSSVPAETKPISLHTIIQASSKSGTDTDVPSLTDRAMLMHLLAETVERLHAQDWLHKGLRSANILLFPGQDGQIDYAEPLISGFDYSRPATSDDMTERPLANPSADIYRHPIVQHKGNKDEANGRESYKKSFDYYSLGLVLLEIACWKTVDQIVGIDLTDAKIQEIWSVQERLLAGTSKAMKMVKSACGNTVENVIRCCLTGPEAFGLPKDCDEKREVVSARLQKAFGEKAVQRLAMKGL